MLALQTTGVLALLLNIRHPATRESSPPNIQHSNRRFDLYYSTAYYSLHIAEKSFYFFIENERGANSTGKKIQIKKIIKQKRRADILCPPSDLNYKPTLLQDVAYQRRNGNSRAGLYSYLIPLRSSHSHLSLKYTLE